MTDTKHTNKKETKAKLPKSTNSYVLDAKKKLRRLKLEMTRNPSLQFNEYLQEDFKFLSSYISQVRQLESDFAKDFKSLNLSKEDANKSRKEYQLRHFKENDSKNFEITNWVFSRKFLRKFGIDKGITIDVGDMYEKVSEPSDLKYRLVTVAEHPESTGLVVVLRQYNPRDASVKHKSTFVELYEFIQEYILFSVSTPSVDDFIYCDHCGEYFEN